MQNYENLKETRDGLKVVLNKKRSEIITRKLTSDRFLHIIMLKIYSSNSGARVKVIEASGKILGLKIKLLAFA